MPAPVPVFKIRRLSTHEYATSATFEAVLNQISISGGKVVTIVSCSTIQPIETFGYNWIDIIYTV